MLFPYIAGFFLKKIVWLAGGFELKNLVLIPRLAVAASADVISSLEAMRHGYGYVYRYRKDTDTRIRHFPKKPDTDTF